jgi:prepilin-type N-terminal cleavage/methylation domain-containing protein
MRNNHDHNRRSGFSLIELIVVVVVIAALSAMAIPSYRATVERSKCDLAIANLRAIWAAQRLFWVENRTYATSVSDLQTSGMLPKDINTDSLQKDKAFYYYITAGTSSNFKTEFNAFATRIKDGQGWGGDFWITQDGVVQGSVSGTRSGKAYTIEVPFMYK